ncbi:MAG TPA: biotin/lipoyl-containing protein [Acidimicrobiia bacterium]|nr:biotin/lipoyl-containing protein [Acidimicrobiia bacterium]
MTLTPDDVRSLLTAFDASVWQEMTLTSGPDRLHVSRRMDGPPPVAAAPSGASGHRVNPGVVSSAAAEITVRSPSVGVFRRAGHPGAPDGAGLGSVVGPGEAIGFVDVMGRVIPVEAEVSGTVSAVLADDGATVEYGEAVARLVPDRGD